MLEQTLYAHFTVPHSGTRYINKAVTNAIGEKEYQVNSPKAYARTSEKQENQKFIFCHIGQRWQDWIDYISTEEPHIKTWITVRSPILTWSTHWRHALDNNFEINSAYQKLGQMRAQYIALEEVAPKVGHIHRVDMDDLSNLGEYLGLDLKEHDRMFSRQAPEMKKALANKDPEELDRLCRGTEFFSAFRDYTTPDIRPFFEELGYDIWWANG
jgi:methionine synthase II (cobalamin-independent)